MRLDTLSPDLVKGADAETWHDVLIKLNLGEMPPRKAKQPTVAERRVLVGWVTVELQRAERAARSTGGRVVMRRLTRYEYNNTLRDLLGVQLDFAENLPPESVSADGFQNNGSVLGISPIQIEYYLKAARLALGKAIVTGPRPEVIKHHAIKSEKIRRVKGPVSNRLGPDSRFIVRLMKFPREGEVVVLIAEGTRDEGARAAAVRKEEFMHKAVRRVGRKLSRGPHTDPVSYTHLTLPTILLV